MTSTKQKRLLLFSVLFLLLAIAAGCIYAFGYYLPKRQEEERLQQQIREYYESKLSLYESENERYADYEIDVAFLGDSLTDGYDLAAYFPQYTVANRGIGGETTHGLEERMQVSLYDLKPKVAVILIGGNNLRTMFDNYERMLADVRASVPDTEIILCSVTSMGGRFAEKNPIAALNSARIKKLGEKYGCIYVDLYTPLLDEQTGEIYADCTTDGAHLTPKGYEILTNAITPAIQTILD